MTLSEASSGQAVGIVVTKSNTVHIVILDGQELLHFMRPIDQPWMKETVSAVGVNAASTALDGAGQLHIAYNAAPLSGDTSYASALHHAVVCSD